MEKRDTASGFSCLFSIQHSEISIFSSLIPMKIVHLVAGAGGMYCGSCLYGNTLAAAMQRLGEEAILAPMYTPIRTDEKNVSVHHIAFGGINVYLQEHFALFRHTPWFLDRLFDSPELLRWVSRRSASVRPEHLGAITVSMLKGEEGRQRKEVEKLVRWLDRDVRPDLVHLNNVMLIGSAREIQHRLGVPVVCTLSGEDIFLEKLTEPYYSSARLLLRQRAAELPAFVAMNRYYADFMADYLAVPRQRIEVIPPGLNLEGHGIGNVENTLPNKQSIAIGYLARICPEKGLHQLAEALKILADDKTLPAVRLRAAGYLDEAERPYLDKIKHQLEIWGLADRFEYLGELDRPGKIAFLQSLDVFSVPTVYRESKGLFALEAWANGVPAVLPAHGTFPELVEDTGGGLLFEPGKPQALADALKQMIQNPDFAAQCGRRAKQIVHERYNADIMARRMVQWYKKVMNAEL
jgi:glycosyltransferase involved in cell wall biosynthesis